MAKSPCRCTNQNLSSCGVFMCVALDMMTKPYITIAAADNNSAKSKRRRNLLLSDDNIAKVFTSLLIRNAQCVMRNDLRI